VAAGSKQHVNRQIPNSRFSETLVGEYERIAPEALLLWWVWNEAAALLTAAVNSTIVAGENLTVGSTVWLPAEGLAPGR
jgi:uncharacterized membrane protein